jgi:hypothetical protein
VTDNNTVNLFAKTADHAETNSSDPIHLQPSTEKTLSVAEAEPERVASFKDRQYLPKPTSYLG